MQKWCRTLLMLHKCKIWYDVTLTATLYYWRVCEGTRPGVRSYRQLSSNYYSHVKWFTHEMFVGRKSEQINPPPPQSSDIHLSQLTSVMWFITWQICRLIERSYTHLTQFQPAQLARLVKHIKSGSRESLGLQAGKRQPVGRRRWADEERRSHERVARPATCNGPAAVHFFTLTVLLRVKKEGMAW